MFVNLWEVAPSQKQGQALVSFPLSQSRVARAGLYSDLTPPYFDFHSSTRSFPFLTSELDPTSSTAAALCCWTVISCIATPVSPLNQFSDISLHRRVIRFILQTVYCLEQARDLHPVSYIYPLNRTHPPSHHQHHQVHQCSLSTSTNIILSVLPPSVLRSRCPLQ
jgi:hypothetical protein